MRRFNDGKKYLFDLCNGDRFRFNHETYEVISDFETEGIPCGLKLLARSRRVARDGTVCAVNVKRRNVIKKFYSNMRVLAY